MTAKPNIVFAGAATLDLIFQVEQLPSGPGKVLPTGLVQVAHGMATSAATAAARLGARCTLISRIGDDTNGDVFLEEITAEGVDCSQVRRFAGVRTPLSAVIVANDGERLIVPYYDPALESDAEWIDRDIVQSADAVLVDVRWPQGAGRVLDLTRSAGKIAMLDADVGPTEVIFDLALRSTHAIFSAPAACAVSGNARVQDAVKTLTHRLDAFVAVTDGADGCFWVQDGTLVQLKAPAVNAIDTLAAGDVFHGALVTALAEKKTFVEAAMFANSAAALSCTVFGGRLGAPRREDVLALLSTQPRMPELI